MILGAAITMFLTPETCDIWGKSRTLEDLSFGKARREELRMRDLEIERENNERREAGGGNRAQRKRE